MNKEIIKKITTVFKIIISIFFILILKIAIIGQNHTLQNKAANQQYIKINIIKRRGDILDRNMRKIVNREKIYKAFVIPKKEDYSLLCQIATKETPKKIKELINKNMPFVIDVRTPNIKNENIKIFEDYKRYPTNGFYPVQLIGHCNIDGEGVAGLELQENEFLKKNSFILDAYIPINGKHKMINPNNIIFKSNSNSQQPLILTIDNKEQYMLDRICKSNIKQGGGVCVDLETGDILAFCSLPTYDPDSPKKDLKRTDNPFLIRPNLNFPIGSIFKIVTAAAAIKAGINPKYKYTCTGAYKYKDTIYRCHKRDGHGEVNMKTAMQKSCNPYFINLANIIGAKNLLNMAKQLGFAAPIKFGKTIKTKKSELPTNDMTRGELCNFAFGQGIIRTSMLHVAQMFLKLNNKNKTNQLNLIKGKNTKNSKKQTILNEEKTNILNEILKSEFTFNNPLGQNEGNIKLKTGTAQTTTKKENNIKPPNTTWITLIKKDKTNREKLFVLLNNIGTNSTEDFSCILKRNKTKKNQKTMHHNV